MPASETEPAVDMKGGAGEQRAAKSQKLGAEGFSAEPDLEVAIEGEVVAVHSILLMLASPVFRQMLSHSMAEAVSGRVELPGKSASEFKVFVEFLQPGSVPELTTEKATFLAQWCDEYQLMELKGRCDVFLVRHAPPDLAGFVHAAKCNLKDRKEQCAAALRSRFDKLDEAVFGELKATGPSLPPEVLELLWPSLCKAAGVPAAAEQDMPGREQVLAIIPFAMSAVGVKKGFDAFERAAQSEREEHEKFKRAAKDWPGKLYEALPADPVRADTMARDKLREIMRNDGFVL